MSTSRNSREGRYAGFWKGHRRQINKYFQRRPPHSLYALREAIIRANVMHPVGGME